MKIFKLDDLEKYREFVRECSEQDQPIFIYLHSINSHLALISSKEVIDPDAEIDKLEPDDITDEDDPLWEDGDEIDETDLFL